MIKTVFFVGIGGGIGSIFRYLTTVLVSKYFNTTFPLATFLANVLGCLIIGLCIGLLDRFPWTNPDLKFLLITGFCGGYTTFSAFSLENLNLIQTGQLPTAFLYMATSVLISLLAVWIGLLLATL